MIEFTNVSKSYKDKLILRDINMTFSSGEFVAIIGSSGCGKTTPGANGLLLFLNATENYA